MPSQGLVLAISGPIRAGKTTLAENVTQAVPAKVLSTRSVLLSHRSDAGDRQKLQELGRALDEATRGRWVLDAAEALYRPDGGMLVVDAVRIAHQLDALRTRFRVTHVHLTAPIPVLRQRWGVEVSRPSYDELRADPTENQVESLASLADLVVDTARSAPEETAQATLDVLQGS